MQAYLERLDLKSALKIKRHTLKANSWVGVIKYKNTHFQILPKLISHNANNDEKLTHDKIDVILKNLIFMLSYTKKLKIKTSNLAHLSKSKNPFLEVLIREYAQSLFDCLKRLTPKKYVREEENLNYLKGKLKFSENIRYNITNQAKFYCEYDEFSENNVLNQLFLFVSTCLYNISNDNYNKKILRFIINYYADIDMILFNKFKVEKIKLTRNQELFNKPFNLAKMFIENTSVDLSKNRFENITLVWDMNKLFEEFVFEIMKKSEQELEWKFEAQKGKRLLANDYNKKRNTKVDIFCTKKDKTHSIIIDTKYKKFITSNDFDNADVFQVSTYCLLHNSDHAILLYPQWDDKKTNIPQCLLNKDGERIKIDFKTINLRYKDLESNIGNIKKEIEELFKENTAC
jgi:5-methylcytosine-specific restriction enzyme subunit McrC